MRRRVIAALVTVAVLGIGVYVPLALLAPLDAATVSETTWAEPIPRTPHLLVTPTVGSSALGAVGYDGLLSQSGSSDPVPIASISKIITALVILETKPLDGDDDGPTITFDSDDAALYDKYVEVLGKVEPMREGVAMSEREALEVILISSANNYTEAVAGWAFGSQPGFVDAAATWIAAHGLTSTTIVEPTGMSPSNVSSSSDLVRLGQIALEHPVVAAIVASASATVPHIGEIVNTNELLGAGGVDGIKTGTLDEAGSCLLFSTDVVVGATSITVIGVVLGGADHDSVDAAVTAMLATVPAGFRDVTLATAGQEFALLKTEWGDTTRAIATEDAHVIVWSDAPVAADIVIREIANTTSGAPAGTVAFEIDGRVRSVELEFDTHVDEPDLWWKLTRPIAELGR